MNWLTRFLSKPIPPLETSEIKEKSSDEMKEEEKPVESKPLPTKSLRPTRLSDFIGQKNVIQNLHVAITACKKRDDVLDHILFFGGPGLGKTTLALLIKNELSVNLHTTSGPMLTKVKVLSDVLSKISLGDLLFIDEIHRTRRIIEEYLYSAMEDYRIDIIEKEKGEHNLTTLILPRFTLIGATTNAGMLSRPFKERFGIVEKLEPYRLDSLVSIIKRSASVMNFQIKENAAYALAKCCRGTPRIANRFLRRIRDFVQCHSDNTWIENEHVQETLHRLQIDSQGLNQIDRRILKILSDQERPISLDTLAVSVGEHEDTIEEFHEPYLIRQGFILRTPRGRLITEEGRTYFKKETKCSIVHTVKSSPVICNGTRQLTNGDAFNAM